MSDDKETLTPEEQTYIESAAKEPAAAETLAESVPAETKSEEPPVGDAKTEQAAGDDKADDKRQKTVPHEALHEERQRRKETEKTLRQLEREKKARDEQFVRLEERTNILLQHVNSQQRPQQQEEAPPDFNTDPQGYIAHLGKQIESLNGQIQRDEANKRAQAEHAARFQARERLLMEAKPEFDAAVQENPAIKDAYDHWMQTRQRELAFYGYDPRTIAETIRNDEAWAVQESRRRNVDLGDMVMQVALLRGFAPKPPQIQAKPDVAKEIANIKKGQEAAATLSGGGGPSDGPLSAEALVNMSEEEFAVTLSKMSKRDQRQLFGG